jgi:hypothetical protein
MLLSVGDEASRKKAEELLGTLVNQNHSGAMRLQAEHFTTDAAAAMQGLRKAADFGDGAAMAKIGNLYASGKGVAQDHTEAVNWYRKAAEKNAPEGQFAYADCLREGRGVAKNEEESKKLFALAAAQKHAPALVRVGQMHLSHEPAEKQQAYQCFQQAAEKGHAEGQYELGVCYEKGIGVEKDLGNAVSWYRKSAQAGFADGQLAYGRCLLRGVGVSPSKGLANVWLKLAAKQGKSEAKKLLAE